MSNIDSKANRATIMANVRNALGVDASSDATRRKTVKARLSKHSRNLIPERANLGAPERLALFRAQAEAVAASVAEIKALKDVPQAVAAYLRDNNLPQRVRHGADEDIAKLPWDSVPTMDVDTGPADPQDSTSVSKAFGGVAETGTLVLTSGMDNPTTLNFLPENHIVVLKAGEIAKTYEDVWDRVREAYGAGQMPRAVNMITGPSRTGDIEQQIELGAHGPRRLHILIVAED